MSGSRLYTTPAKTGWTFLVCLLYLTTIHATVLTDAIIERRNVDQIQKVLHANRNPNIVNERSEIGTSPLMLAVNAEQWEVVKILLQEGAASWVKERWNDQHLSPLEKAVKDGTADTRTVEQLLENAMGIITFHPGFLTQLIRTYPDIIPYLSRRNISMTQRNIFGETPIVSAIQLFAEKRIPLDYLKLLLLSQNPVELEVSLNTGKLALIEALCLEAWEVVELLLQHGADVTAEMPDGDSPLGQAVVSAIQPSLFQKMLQSNPTKVEKYIKEHPSLIEEAKVWENSMLADLLVQHKAATAGEVKTGDWLNGESPKLRARGKDASTALLEAVVLEDWKIAEALLENGAVASRRVSWNNLYSSPLEKVVQDGTAGTKMVELMIENSEEKLMRSPDFLNQLLRAYPDIIPFLGRKKVPMTEPNIFGESPIITAVRLAADRKIARTTLGYLLQSQDPERLKDSLNTGKIALIEALCLEAWDIVELLLRYGAEATAELPDGDSPLAQAVVSRIQPSLLERMLAANPEDARKYIKDHRNLVDQAIVWDRWDLVKVLLEYIE